MQTEPRSHVLVALALAAACAAVFLSQRLGTDDPLPPPTVKPAAVRTGQGAANPTSEVPAPLRAEADRSEGSTGTTERAALRWIEGRVVFPPGTPEGETVVVRTGGKYLVHDAQPGAPVGPDGRFRIAVPAQSKATMLWLDADHLYLTRGPTTLPDDGELVLEPLLGGHLFGRAVPPDGVPGLARGLVGATVLLKSDGSAGVAAVTYAKTALTEDLAFEFRGVPAGMVRLSCKSDGYLRAETTGVVVAAGADRSVELAFPSGVRLAGRAVYADGTPAKRATVNLRISSRGSPGGTVKTDDEGRFAFFGIEPGPIGLRVEADGAPSANWGPEGLSEGDVVDDLTLTLGGAARLTGTVRHPDGTPPRMAQVVVLPRWAGGSRTAFVAGRTDAEGRFEFLRLEGDRFDVHAEAPRPGGTSWVADATDVLEGQHLVLTLSTGLTCAGHVLDDLGRPVETFSVSAWPSGGTTIGTGPWCSLEGVRDGAFELAGLAPGTWMFRATKEEAQSEVVAVHIPTAEPVTLTLPRLATLAGVLLDRAGRHVPGARVELQRRDTSLPSMREGPKQTSDAQGTFAFEREAPGPVALMVRADGFPPFEQLLTLAPGERRDDLRVVLGGGARIVVRLASASGAVSGRVVTLSGDALAESLPERTDEGGELTFENLAAGTYRVQCYPSAEERAGVGPREFRDLIERLGLEAHVVVTDGETEDVVLGAGPARRIRVHGRVLLGDAPVAEASIEVTRASKGEREQPVYLQSDPEGRYEWIADGPGEVEIEVSSEQIVRTLLREVLPEAESFALDLVLPVGRASVRVHDTSGAPLAEIPVCVGREGDTSRLPAAWARTDAEGRCEFHGLAAGSWTFMAGGGLDEKPWDPTPAKFGLVQRDAIELARGAETTLEFQLSPAGCVTGRVTDLDGAPIDHAAIFVRGVGGQLLTSGPATHSGKGGTYRVQGLAPGRVALLACDISTATREERAIDVRPGAEGVLDLVVEPATIVLVRVVDSEGESVGADLWLVDSLGRPAAARTIGARGMDLRLGPVPPGEYTLRAEAAHGRGEVRFQTHGERATTAEVVVR